MLELEAFGIRSFKGYQRLHCIMLWLKNIWGHIYDPRLYVHSLLWIF